MQSSESFWVMRRILLAALFLSSSHAFVLVPSAHAHPLAAPPSAHVHPLVALPLTRAHPLVARRGALPHSNDVAMILNPFTSTERILDELEKVCVLPTPPCTRAERGIRATHFHTRIPLQRNLIIHAATSPLRLSVAVSPPRSCPAGYEGAHETKNRGLERIFLALNCTASIFRPLRYSARRTAHDNA